MDHVQLKAIRKKFYPDDRTAFLMEMGYSGNRNTLNVRARRFENGDIPIPEPVARFALLLDYWRIQNVRLGGNFNDLPDWGE